MTTIRSDVMPSAVPTEAEIEAWQALPRDEQMRRMRLSLDRPGCQVESKATMADILAACHARADTRRNG
jgi:hypothetical protein